MKSLSCEKVGRAVAGIPVGARVVKTELYETSPPPGNNGGAVSGAVPCPKAVAAQTDKARVSQNILLRFTIPPTKNDNSRAHESVKPGNDWWRFRLDSEREQRR